MGVLLLICFVFNFIIVMLTFEVNKRHGRRCENLFGLFTSLKFQWKCIFRIHDTPVYCRKSSNFFLEVLDGTVCYLPFLLEQLQIIFLLVIYLSSDKDLKSRIAVCCMHLPLFSSQNPFICGFDAVSSACFLAHMALPHCFL